MVVTTKNHGSVEEARVHLDANHLEAAELAMSEAATLDQEDMAIVGERDLPIGTPDEAQPFRLTIVVPIYNEVKTAVQVVTHLLELTLPTPIEVLVVDDGSSDGTTEALESLKHPHLRVMGHKENCGKGKAVLTALRHVTGSHVLVFDGDSEYDPGDIPRVIQPLLTGRAEVVYGSRMSGFGTVHPTFTHLVGNRLMTFAANVLFGAALSDLHTCIKILPVPLLHALDLTESRFALDTEISAELLRLGFRPYEIPISYVGRSKEEGKKIKFADAFRCVYVLLKIRFRPRTRYGNRDRSLAPPVYVPRSA